MTLQLFSHPFASYCWKALIALYENNTPFSYRMLDGEHADNGVELARLWPPGKFPVLLDGARVVPEASAIIDYLHVHHKGPVRLIPDDPDAAVQVRLMDRVFDNHVMTPMQTIVGDYLKPPERRDPDGVAQAKAALDVIYGWLDAHMQGREWAAGDFSLADCAAAPSLFYADWVRPMNGRFAALAAYRARLLARPSVARVVDEARPYRCFFPPGAPDRD
jgi:glutathione S-transferase